MLVTMLPTAKLYINRQLHTETTNEFVSLFQKLDVVVLDGFGYDGGITRATGQIILGPR
jgi:hypothetical protein